MDDKKQNENVTVSFTVSKRILKIIAIALGLLVLSMLPGGILFVTIVAIIALILTNKK